MTVINVKKRTFSVGEAELPLAPIFDELKALVPNIGFFRQLQFSEEGELIAMRLNKNAKDQVVTAKLTAEKVMAFEGYADAVAIAEDEAEEASIRQAIADEAFEADERTKALRKRQAERKEKRNAR